MSSTTYVASALAAPLPPVLRSATAESRSPDSDLPPPDAGSAALRLTRWATDHEVRPSRRTWESLDRISLPTHQDSLAYRCLAAQPDAAALLAAWTLLVQIAARLPRPLRGCLVTVDGYAYTAEDLALMTGFPEPFFLRALDFFQNPEVGWLAPVSADAISCALEEIELHRAEEDARQAERAAEADFRRRQRRARKLTAPMASTTADSSGPDLRTPDSDLRPSNPDLPPPQSAIRNPPPAIPTEPPPDWRERMLANLPPEETEMRAKAGRFVWSELSPRLQHGILQLYAEPRHP